MATVKAIWDFLVKYGGAACDFGAITIGAISGFTTLFSPKTLTALLVTGGLLAAWRQFFSKFKVSA